MPITPLTALLFDHSYVSMEWPVLETVTPPPRPPFVMHQECSLNESTIHIYFASLQDFRLC